jgi:hypothetical protein
MVYWIAAYDLILDLYFNRLALSGSDPLCAMHPLQTWRPASIDGWILDT